MRFVIYDDETLEPITVVSVRGLADRDIERMGRRLRLVPPYLSGPFVEPEGPPIHEPLKIVELWFERFRRREQLSWMCFTREIELAMLLDPDWLPGQRGAVQRLEQENHALTKLIMAAFRA